MKLINMIITAVLDPNLFFSRFSFFESDKQAIDIKFNVCPINLRNDELMLCNSQKVDLTQEVHWLLLLFLNQVMGDYEHFFTLLRNIKVLLEIVEHLSYHQLLILLIKGICLQLLLKKLIKH